MSGFSEYLEALRIPAVYSCIRVISDAVASLPLIVLDENNEEVDLKAEAPDLLALLEMPSDNTTGRYFRQVQTQDLLLTGNSITVMDNINGLGQPGALYRVRPDRVRVFVQLDGQLVYKYQTGSSAVYDKEFTQDQVLHWKFANPLDPIWGIGEVEAGEVTLSSDRLLAEMIRSYFDQGAVLSGVITLPQEDLTDKEYNRLMSRWRAQRARGKINFKTGVLTGGAQYKAIQEPLGNLPIVQLKKMSRNEVLEIFGVPPAKLGDFVGSNYRNSQEADAYFYTETIAPKAKNIEPGWTALVQRWNPKWHASFVIPSLAADFESRAKAAHDMAAADSFERNEIRTTFGVHAYPKGDPKGTVIVNINKQPMLNEPGDDSVDDELPGLEPASAQASDDDNPSSDNTEEGGSGEKARLARVKQSMQQE